MVNIKFDIIKSIIKKPNDTLCLGQLYLESEPKIIKFIKKNIPDIDLESQILNEFKLTKELESEFILQSSRLEEYNKYPAIIYEYFNGETLKEYIQDNKLSIKETLDIILQITKGLIAIHQKNVIHNSFNPLNILINPNTKQIKITGLDFSSTKNNINNKQLRHNYSIEFLSYISPEQTGRINKDMDFRSDIYSLGMIFYEMLTGILPCRSSDPLEIIHCQIAKTPVVPSKLNKKIPGLISEIVMKCLQKNTEDRYQTASGLYYDLNKCLIDLEVHNSINSFILGQKDTPNLFQISQKLYGREKNIKYLTKNFETVYKGKTILTFISGYSGVGKTSLVNELLRPIISKNGYFISGKFEKLKKNIPYFAFIQAINDLVKQILAEPEKKYLEWKKKILHALGPNGQVLIDIIPDLETLLGKQPSVSKLDPLETKNRFKFVFKNFMQVLTTQNQPLVIFLDDLQWSDSASLELLKTLGTEPSFPHLYLLGAYRDNEVDSAHILKITIDELHTKIRANSYLLENILIDNLYVKSLEIKDINQLLSDSLYTSNKSCGELTQIVFAKTNGNPFFIKQFLNELNNEKGIFFNPTESKWSWDKEKINKINISDNLAEFMANKITVLPEKTQEVLKIAACIGIEFNINTLSSLIKKTVKEVHTNIMPAISEGFVVSIGSAYEYFQNKITKNPTIIDSLIMYKFSHDKVHQAVYSLQNEHTRKNIHQKISSLLLEKFSAKEIENNIFDILNHYNKAADLVVSTEEKIKLAKLNCIAGNKAKLSLAYDAANNYFSTSKSLLPQNIWKKDYSLSRETFIGIAESEFLLKNYDQAKVLFNDILSKSKTILEKSEIYNIQSILLTLQGKPKEAVCSGLKGLYLLGIKISLHPNMVQISYPLIKILFKLKKISVPGLPNLKEMSNPLQLAKIKLLMNITGPAYQFNLQLFTLIIIKMVELSLKYGNSEYSPYAYAAYGIIASSGLKRFKEGFDLAKTAFDMNQVINNPAVFSRICLAQGGMIYPWVKHLKKGEEILINGIRYGMEAGDFIYASWNVFFIINNAFLMGQPLDEVMNKYEKYSYFASSDQAAINFITTTCHMVLCLKGKTESSTSLKSDFFNEQEFSKNLASIKPPLFWYYVSKLFLFYLYKDYKNAHKIALQALKYIEESIGTFWVSEFYIFYTLTLIALYKKANPWKKLEYTISIKKNLITIKRWFKSCPENFSHKYYLIQAELSALKNPNDQVNTLKLYDKAIELAEKYGFTQINAISNELAAKYLFKIELKQNASTYLEKAVSIYSEWGASAKTKSLEENFSKILQPKTIEMEKTTPTKNTTPLHFNLDIATVIKASQVISREIRLRNLITKLMNIIIENAGATKGMLLLEKKGDFVVEAIAETNIEKIEICNSKKISDKIVPVDAILFVKRTKAQLLYDKETSSDKLQKDLYIIKNDPKTILCIPILKKKTELLGIIYLENNLVSGTFSEERIELLKTIATQAAISIENAKLYEKTQNLLYKLEVSNEKKQELNLELHKLNKNLEERVKEEVSERKKAMQVAEKMSYQAALSSLNSGITHEINNPLGIIESDTYLLKEILGESNNRISTDTFSKILTGSKTNSKEVWQDLLKRGYIEQDGTFAQTFRPHLRGYKTQIDEKFASHKDEILFILHEKYKSSRIKKYSESIAKNIRRTLDITNTMLKHGKADSGEKEKLNIRDILKEFQTMFIGNCKKNNVKLEMDLGDMDYHINADAIRLNQILLNLGKNGIQAMDNNPLDKEKILRIGLTSKIFVNKDEEKTSGVEITISDTGCGIAKEHLDKIFDPFFTNGKQRTKGANTGLGLSIILKIISDHNGIIHTESELGKGTTFKVYFPLA